MPCRRGSWSGKTPGLSTLTRKEISRSRSRASARGYNPGMDRLAFLFSHSRLLAPWARWVAVCALGRLSLLLLFLGWTLWQLAVCTAVYLAATCAFPWLVDMACNLLHWDFPPGSMDIASPLKVSLYLASPALGIVPFMVGNVTLKAGLACARKKSDALGASTLQALELRAEALELTGACQEPSIQSPSAKRL